MNFPIGGLTTVFHLIIIFLYQKSKAFVSLLTIMVVLAFSAIGLYGMVRLGTNDNSNYAYVKELLTYCQPVEIDKNKPMVVLRVDDVQAFTWREVSMKMIADAEERSIPLTLGVIPVGLDEDEELVTFLRSKRCFIEFAQHGWNHRDNPPEFANLSREEAIERINRGRKVLEKVTGEGMDVFIPPANKYSEGTKEALNELGFEIISGEGSEVYDYTGTTHDWTNRQNVEVDKVIDGVKESISHKGYAIIMLHPQDYASGNSLDEEKYLQFQTLLDGLLAENVAIAALKDLQNVNAYQDN